MHYSIEKNTMYIKSRLFCYTKYNILLFFPIWFWSELGYGQVLYKFEIHFSLGLPFFMYNIFY